MPQSFNQQAMQSLVSATYMQHPHSAEPRRVVTISRDCGCGGQAVAQQISEQLGLPLYDRELLEAVVERSRMEPELVRQLDENAHCHVSGFLQSLLSHEEVRQWSYRKALVNVLAGVLNTGGVVLGRGAHVVLAGKGIFRVRLVGGVEYCARRLLEERRVADLTRALAQVREINQKRADFLRDHFHAEIDDPRQYDLIVNTDHIQPQHVVNIIVCALERRLVSQAA